MKKRIAAIAAAALTLFPMTAAFASAADTAKPSYDFVIFARQYKELENGIYLMKIQKGNIIVDVAKAIKGR